MPKLVTAYVKLGGERRVRKPRTRPAENADQLRRAPAVVADGDDVAEGAPALLTDALEDIDEAVGRGAAAENHDARLPPRRICGRSS